MSQYQAILIFLENYYLTIQGFPGFISTETEKFREFLPDNEDFFKVHICQSYCQVLYTFQSSYKPILIFSDSYYQTIHAFQGSYVPVLIFSKSYYPTIYIFLISYKPLTNKITKTFSEFKLNNISIFGELLSSDTDFFKVELILILRTIFRKIVPNNCSDLGLFLTTRLIASGAFFPNILGVC